MPPRRDRSSAAVRSLLCGALCLAAGGGERPRAQTPTALRDPELRQFGNVVYRIPDGWRTGSRRSCVILTPKETRKTGSCTIWIAFGDARPANGKQWLMQRMRATVGKGEKLTTEKVAQASRIAGREVFVAGQSVDRDLQMHLGLPAGDRIEHVWFEGPADENGSATLSAVFQPFVADLRFVSAGASPLLGAPRTGDLDGTWFGVGTGFGTNGIEMQNRFWIFTREGRFYEGIPSGRSRRTLDFAKACAREGGCCGNYRLAGGKLELDYADGHTRSLDVRPEADRMTIGRDTFWPQTDIADGTRLDGCWTLLDYRSFGEGTSVSGGVGYTRSLTLRPDGTFASAGLGFASATFENSAGQYDGGFSSGSRTGKTAGKYEFRDGVLILRADDGSEVRHNAFPLSPRVLLIDGVAHIDGSKPEK